MDYRTEIDYSSLELYITCPRRFFFRYMLHLEPSAPSVDLAFGSCWHLGLEVAYRMLMHDPTASAGGLTELAFTAFTALWAEDAQARFGWDETFPKSPSRARQMYYEYFQRWLADDSQLTILAVEHAFTIAPEGGGLPVLRGRLDRAAADQDGDLLVFESKTSKYATPTVFLGYESTIQTDIYIAVGSLWYDKLPTMVYDQALCQKSKIDFTRYEIHRSAGALDRFLDEYVYYTSELLRELDIFDAFSQHGDADQRTLVMPCFRRKPGYACTMYFRACPYWDLCRPRNNPLSYAAKLPQGFHHREWHPANHEQHHRALLESAGFGQLLDEQPEPAQPTKED